MLQTFKNGQTSIILRVKLLDSSVSTGAGLTGLTSASSGLRISTIADNEATATAYTVAGSTIETITTLGTYAAPTATKVRFKEVDATNHPGVYELHFANARFAVASAKSLLVSLGGATNLAQTDFVVQLQSDDPYVAKPTNFATFSIDGSGRVDVAKVSGTTQTAKDIGAAVPSAAAGASGGLLISGSNAGTTTLGALTVTGAMSINGTGNVAQTGDSFARIGSNGASLTALATAANLTTLAGYVDTEVAAILAIAVKLDSAMESDGAVYRFTTNALEMAPSGGGGGLDAAGVRAAIGLASANLDTQLDALPTAVENADALLGRNVSGGSSSGRTVKQAFHVMRNKTTVSGGTLTVFDTDDSTSSWTASVSSDPAADPITGIDPS